MSSLERPSQFKFAVKIHSGGSDPVTIAENLGFVDLFKSLPGCDQFLILSSVLFVDQIQLPRPGWISAGIFLAATKVRVLERS